jgi:hypothetical protein
MACLNPIRFYTLKTCLPDSRPVAFWGIIGYSLRILNPEPSQRLPRHEAFIEISNDEARNIGFDCSWISSEINWPEPEDQDWFRNLGATSGEAPQRGVPWLM